ncbi:hypothetical protein AKJ09_00157 [Labilithrix luteola]|uniref:DUF2029 domain-containing protein n=1 Tax=Labilithrix luteola TaxID=1391654 RepID=A0A0K1PIX3_9BACT|nr:glycosyltransferase family 87 protein [Labilithrix luteola]AKU93493.1 hypothetical protein AKJ09_00157 [Labilithrix luteola]
MERDESNENEARGNAGDVRAEHWLDERRLRTYPKVVVGLLVVSTLALLSTMRGMVDRGGEPLGYDFVTFWAASFMALKGRAAEAYDLRAIFEAEKTAVPALRATFAWFYPPTFHLVVLPLALLPYLASYLAFVVATLAGYVAVFRRIVRNREAMWCLAAFPGIWIDALHGQNAFLTSALIGAALLNLRSRPILAGVWIGLLAVKPHLALVFPVVLIATRAWRTLATAAVVATLFLALGTAVLGSNALFAFVHGLSFARSAVENGVLPWDKMPTVFAMVRLCGAPVALAWAAHALVACGAIHAVYKVWRRTDSLAIRGAAFTVTTLLVSPYLFDYDLTLLAFPLAWMSLTGQRLGWNRFEREWLVAAWLLPLATPTVASAVGAQVGPPVLLALLAIAVRQSRVHSESRDAQTL